MSSTVLHFIFQLISVTDAFLVNVMTTDYWLMINVTNTFVSLIELLPTNNYYRQYIKVSIFEH